MWRRLVLKMTSTEMHRSDQCEYRDGVRQYRDHQAASLAGRTQVDIRHPYVTFPFAVPIRSYRAHVLKITIRKSIPTLRHYIVISQAEILVDHFERIRADEWHCHSMRDRNGIVAIPEPPISLVLDDVYRRVF